MENQLSSPTTPEDYKRKECEDSREEVEEKNKGSKAEPGKEKEDNLLKKERESIHLDIPAEGDHAATLPLRKNKDEESEEKSKKKEPPIYLFPITRLRNAWSSSENICEFFIQAIVIIFSTLGWMFCAGGFPFLSVALLVIGSIYVNDCKIQPKIPVYLIVSGVIGTLQHLIAIWTKYVPKDSQGKLGDYRSYCKAVEGIIQLFSTVWFVLGCIWVYGAYSEVEYKDITSNAYCNKTVYRFAFWILNIAFMILALLAVAVLCCIVCVLAFARKQNQSTESNA